MSNLNSMFCPFTCEKVEYRLIDGGYMTYSVILNDKEYVFFIKDDFNIWDSQYYIEYSHIFQGLVLNNRWPKQFEIIIDNENDLRRIIDESNPPIGPKQKIEYLFKYIFNSQKYEGQRFTNVALFNEHRHQYFYLKAGIELDYYIKTLQEMGLIQIFGKAIGSYGFEITYKGLEYAILLEEEGRYSNNCFVAMSFQKGREEIRKVIKEAIRSNGFNPVLIDEEIYNSEQTINDAMLASIKKSKFCVADFTDQRHNVYFEAGYALGRGIPVIYLCQSDSWDQTHFDTNHFPHIKYKDAEELRRMLSEAIQARILL